MLPWIKNIIMPPNSHFFDPLRGVNLGNDTHSFGSTIQLSRVVKSYPSPGFPEPVSPHNFRHYFAACLPVAGHDIHKVQEIPGCKDVKITMIYSQCTQALANRSAQSVRLKSKPGVNEKCLHFRRAPETQVPITYLCPCITGRNLYPYIRLNPRGKSYFLIRIQQYVCHQRKLRQLVPPTHTPCSGAGW